LNTLSPPSPKTPDGALPPGPSYLIKRSQKKQVLGWWYRFTAPTEPKGEASFQELEHFRRGRVGSQIILALYVLLFVSVLAQFVGTNRYLDYIVGGAAFLLTGATILNRAGKVQVAGYIVVLTFLAFPIANIVTTPGGLSMMILPLFGLLVLPVVCAVSFLPPWWAFIIAAINICFTLYALTSLPRTVEVDAILAVAFAGIMTPIILTQLIISVVAYIWVHGTTQALQRADRAEQIARLEHDLAKQAEESARQKEQLDRSVQLIQETHVRVANGDFNARVSLTQDNILWQISGSLNNLLNRLQRQRQEVADLTARLELRQSHEEAVRLKQNPGHNNN